MADAKADKRTPAKVPSDAKRKRVFVGVLYGDDNGQSFLEGMDMGFGVEYGDMPQVFAAVTEALASKHLGPAIPALARELSAVGIKYAALKDPEGAAGFDDALIADLVG